ncbi:DUF4153 domain-containing protein [Nocardiopsis oceani]
MDGYRIDRQEVAEPADQADSAEQFDEDRQGPDGAQAPDEGREGRPEGEQWAADPEADWRQHPYFQEHYTPPPHYAQPLPPWPPPPRPKAPLPQAPVWLPLAVLGVGTVALFLATLSRPGLGLVITGVVAGLTALTALLVRPAIPEGAEPTADSADGSGPEEEDRAEDAREDRTGDGYQAESEGAEEPEVEDRDQAKDEVQTEDTGSDEDRDADAGPDAEQVAESDNREPGPNTDRYRYAWSAVYGVLSAVLLATAAVRDADWVLVWTLLGSFVLASLAFAVHNPAARRGPVAVAAGALALLRNVPAVPAFLVRPLARLKASNRTFVPALATAGATFGLLVVFGGLFAYADPVFSSHVENLFTSFSFDVSALHPVGAVLVMLFTGAAVLAARRHPNPKPVTASAPKPEWIAQQWPTWTWSFPLGALAVLFAAFLVVQATAMFGGEDHVQRVAGMTYAEYARQGFFQLVVVSLLVLGVVALVVRLVPDRPSGTRLLRNAVLGVLCVLTLVILASAMMRLQLYIDVFGLTRMRATAEAWIAWSALVFGLVIAVGVLNTLGRPARWLPRVTVAVGAAALAVFAYSNPDLRVAESHHELDLADIDTRYLQGMSADAVPGLLGLEGDDQACAMERIGVRLAEPDPLAELNLSRERARGLLSDEEYAHLQTDRDENPCSFTIRGY